MHAAAIVMHPDTLAKFLCGDWKIPPDYKYLSCSIYSYEQKIGMNVFTYKWLPKTAKFPVFPDWPYTTWEPADAKWAVPLGIATVEERPYFILLTKDDLRLGSTLSPGTPLVVNDYTVRNASARKYSCMSEYMYSRNPQ